MSGLAVSASFILGGLLNAANRKYGLEFVFPVTNRLARSELVQRFEFGGGVHCPLKQSQQF